MTRENRAGGRQPGSPSGCSGRARLPHETVIWLIPGTTEIYTLRFHRADARVATVPGLQIVVEGEGRHPLGSSDLHAPVCVRTKPYKTGQGIRPAPVLRQGVFLTDHHRAVGTDESEVDRCCRAVGITIHSVLIYCA